MSSEDETPDAGLLGEVAGAVAEVLSARHGAPVQLGADAGLGNPAAWDSLAFVEVFDALSRRYGLDTTDDDAVHFLSVRDIARFVARHRT
jgi:acyl carrier protein